MKIIVVSLGNIERCHTLRLLDGYGCTVVVHDKKAMRRLSREFPNHEIVVSRTTDLVSKRNWILKNLVDKNEWFIGMDDNIQYFTRVIRPFRMKDSNSVTEEPPQGFKNWREIYNHKIPAYKWLNSFSMDIGYAIGLDINLVGVATMENPFFRAKRYSNYRFVKTKVFAMKNTGKLYFNTNYSHDSWLSAQCIALYGKVLVDSFLHYKTKMYEAGGLGNREEREAKGFLRGLRNTIKAFPGLVGMGHGKNTALRILLTRESSVERWREENNYV